MDANLCNILVRTARSSRYTIAQQFLSIRCHHVLYQEKAFHKICDDTRHCEPKSSILPSLTVFQIRTCPAARIVNDAYSSAYFPLRWHREVKSWANALPLLSLTNYQIHMRSWVRLAWTDPWLTTVFDNFSIYEYFEAIKWFLEALKIAGDSWDLPWQDTKKFKWSLKSLSAFLKL